jgi:hypothetical protein
MQRLEVSGAVRPLLGSLGVKGLNIKTLNHEDSFLYSVLMYSGYTALRYC